MQVNVAQLLKEPTGATRALEIDGPLEDTDGTVLGHAKSVLKLTKTNRGIWASGAVKVTVEDVCSRCLRPVTYTVQVQVDDEYLPPVDVVTGARLRYTDEVEADTESIDSKHVLDLSETLREYRLAALPLAPVCKEDCQGICPQCGVDLNEGTHECQAEVDPRWEKLRELLR